MAFKDIFDRTFVTELGTAIQELYPSFDANGFVEAVLDAGWPERALMDRMRHIRLTLQRFLPADYPAALDILRRTAEQITRHELSSWVFADYVATYGLEDWEVSIPALEQFTRHMSAEFAVRPFIVRYGRRMLDQMLIWARSEDPALRRLASEGSRPRLPWGIALNALKADPAPLLPILEQLYRDPNEGVRRSVANNLNDIAKDNPEVVIDLLRRWSTDGNSQTQWIVNHALRTLVKAGHPDALALVGAAAGAAVEVRQTAVEPSQIPMGGKVILTFDIVSTADESQELVIDYVVYLLRANGQHTPKVFKLCRRTIAPGEVLHITRAVDFRPVTTRRYYPGPHAVAPQVNGQIFEQVSFVINP